MGDAPSQPTGEHAPNWMRALDPRELAQVYHALAYAKDYRDAGAPGHGQFMLLAKLAALLDAREPHESGEQVV